MTLYLCTRSDEQYPRGCIYDYLILPVKKNAKFLTPRSTVFLFLFLSRENGFFDIWPLFSFFFAFSLSSFHLISYGPTHTMRMKNHI